MPRMLLVATPEVPVLYHSRALLTNLQILGPDLDFPIPRSQIVLNRAGSKTGVSTAEAQAALAQPVTWTLANDRAAMRALALGRPVMLEPRGSRLARDVSRIVQHLANVPAPPSRIARLLKFLDLRLTSRV